MHASCDTYRATSRCHTPSPYRTRQIGIYVPPRNRFPGGTRVLRIMLDATEKIVTPSETLPGVTRFDIKAIGKWE